MSRTWKIEAPLVQQSAEFLLIYVMALTPEERRALLPGLPWLSCYALSPDFGGLVSRTSLLVMQSFAGIREECKVHTHNFMPTPWTEFLFALRPIFAAKMVFRERGAKELLDLLPRVCARLDHVPWWFEKARLPELVPIVDTAKDPFKHCLHMKQKILYDAAVAPNQVYFTLHITTPSTSYDYIIVAILVLWSSRVQFLTLHCECDSVWHFS